VEVVMYCGSGSECIIVLAKREALNYTVFIVPGCG
jgi:hypothetical protein